MIGWMDGWMERRLTRKSQSLNCTALDDVDGWMDGRMDG